MPEKRLTAVDLFCGCGGFSLGLIQAGWEVVAAIDNDPGALATYYTNLCDDSTKIIGEIPSKKQKYFHKHRTSCASCKEPDEGCKTKLEHSHCPYAGWLYHENRHRKKKIPPVSVLFCTDVTELHGWNILEAAGLDHVNLVVGGPPCQSFSAANTKKKKGDFRDFMVFEFGRLVLEMNPDTFCMVNVPTLMNHKLPGGRKLLDEFYKFVNNKDWDLYYSLLEEYLEWKYIAEGSGKKMRDV
ncbi:MAG: DNA cytosine methyltransferase [Methanolobus sp.]|uniref:DNA cytosine methyltransferase n=1 Tax=Methanolobus sp. TaxID=1874737 RepID=UPI0027321A2B|nr:DNA cytosine methyltransferase [Methanolobus sp.]MDP2217228.1 DNA cytosine methyltransferase [Methanolobus sp.]